jgi:large subunit ribosomal protein LP1
VLCESEDSSIYCNRSNKIWAQLYAKAISAQNIHDLLTQVSAGGASAGGAAAAAPSAAGGEAAAAEEEKEEEKEESDEDMGMGLFD